MQIFKLDYVLKIRREKQKKRQLEERKMEKKFQNVSLYEWIGMNMDTKRKHFFFFCWLEGDPSQQKKNIAKKLLDFKETSKKVC